MTTTQEITKASELGEAAGKAAGSWVIDGNTTLDRMRAILRGWQDGDPEIMDLEPASPLSGEMAGESLIEIFGHDPSDEEMSAYEDSFHDGFWDTVNDSLRYHLPEDDSTLS